MTIKLIINNSYQTRSDLKCSAKANNLLIRVVKNELKPTHSIILMALLVFFINNY